MTFNSHKIVKEYVEELKKLTEVRDHTRAELLKALDAVFAAETESDLRTAKLRSKELEIRLNIVTSKAERYIRKIDELNGVR